jgi:hypothetical protein
MSITLNWNQLVNEETLPDGDRIAVQVTAGAVSPEKIQIVLELGSAVTWWKGFNASEMILCQCQDKLDYSAARLNYEDFKQREFTFWKAKFFGIHTPMYCIGNQNDVMKGGNSYLFQWLKD